MEQIKEQDILNGNLGKLLQLVKELKVANEMKWWNASKRCYETYKGLDVEKLDKYRELLIKEINEYLDVRLGQVCLTSEDYEKKIAEYEKK